MADFPKSGATAPVTQDRKRTVAMARSVQKALRTAGLIAAIAGSPAAMAATTTATFGITATVQATCLISATDLAFGTYTGVVSDTTATISVTCTNTTPYNLGLSAGGGVDATITARNMTGPAATVLNYGLYQDEAYATNWGNTVDTDTLAGTGNGVVQDITIYGRTPASQFVDPGSYADTITATVTF